MKALSLKQPWLYAMTDLDKDIENRTWKPPEWIIGQRIALHASKVDDKEAEAEIKDIAGVDIPPYLTLPRGFIVATTKVAGWLDEDGFGDLPSPCLGHLVDDKWFFGPYGWIFEDIQKLRIPIPCRGALRLWNVPEAIEDLINETETVNKESYAK